MSGQRDMARSNQSLAFYANCARKIGTILANEALGRARLKLMTDEEKPYHAHPMFWAPFVVVGEGGVPAG